MSADRRTLRLRQSRPTEATLELHVLVVDAGAAVAARRVDADARCSGRGRSGARCRPRRSPASRWSTPSVSCGQRLVGRALGQQVDRAADAAAAGRGAVQEGAGAAQHFDALEQLGRRCTGAAAGCRGRCRRRRPNSARKPRMKYDSWKLPKPRATPHRRVVQQHVAHALRLLVLDQLVGVAGARERRVHVCPGCPGCRRARRAPPGRRRRAWSGPRPRRRRWLRPSPWAGCRRASAGARASAPMRDQRLQRERGGKDDGAQGKAGGRHGRFSENRCK